VAGGGAVVLLALLMVRHLTADTPEDLLTANSPTPAQVRKIAETLLVHPDLSVRSRAGAKLSELGDRAKLILQEVATETRDSELRFAALGVLRSVDLSAAAQVVGTMGASPDAQVRREAVKLAGTMESPGATGVLEKAIEDPDPGIRSAAAATLDPRTSASAAAKLRAALNDPNYDVSRHAARQLRLLQQP
jgi:HEAT repeat protein